MTCFPAERVSSTSASKGILTPTTQHKGGRGRIAEPEPLHQRETRWRRWSLAHCDLRQDKGYVCIEIQDTGKGRRGAAAQDIRALFLHREVRTSMGPVPRRQGRKGYGASSKLSARRKGNIFYLFCRPLPWVSEAKPRESRAGQNLSDRTILVVDDEYRVRELLKASFPKRVKIPDADNGERTRDIRPASA